MNSTILSKNGWQRRNYQLLPSQTASIIDEEIPAAKVSPVRLAETVDTTVTHANDLTYPVRLRADILDPAPNQGTFLKDNALHPLQGAIQQVWNAREANHISKLWLDSEVLYRSTMSPFQAKSCSRILIEKLPKIPGQVSTIRLMLSADRRPHITSTGIFLGPTLSIGAFPSFLPFPLAESIDSSSMKVIGIDVSPLTRVNKREAGQYQDIQNGLSEVTETIGIQAVQEVIKLARLGHAARESVRRIVEQLFTFFWTADGERFSLDLLVSGEEDIDSHEAVHLTSSELHFDDDSLFRQQRLSELRRDSNLMWGKDMGTFNTISTSAIKHDLHPLELLAEKSGMIYRKHKGGNVGLFGYGAGMGMGSIDGLIEQGGRPANFFDGGGGASVENAKEAMRILSLDEDVQCILLNIFGGITRSDLVSQGIVEAFKEYGIDTPLVARFRGNKAQEAKSILRDSRVNVEIFDDYPTAAKRATQIADSTPRTLQQIKISNRNSRSHAPSTISAAFAPSQSNTTLFKRDFSTSARRYTGTVQALNGIAFAGKPRYADTSEEGSGDAEKGDTSTAQLPRQGFPLNTMIGEWVDQMLDKGEAGEDALVVSEMKGKGDWILAVADGVGGWSENGVDPALFSQALMYHAGQYAKQFYACPERLEAEDMISSANSSPPTSPLDTPPASPGKDAALNAEPGTPLDILQYAYQETLSQKEVAAGSATACILTFDSSKGMLRSANLGDSGFLLLRPGTSSSDTTNRADDEEVVGGLHTVHYQSKPQTHGFNTPLQLSKLPPEYRFDGSIDSQPSHSATWNVRVRDGDIALIATDGFWDNVSTPEVLQLVAFIRRKHRTAWIERMSDISTDNVAEERDLANVLAYNLLSYARMCQFSTSKTSPFERDAARHGIHYPGGKVDDIALIVSLIVER